MCLVGQTESGVYIDDYEDIHPTVLAQYHGVHGHASRRAAGETGAGQLDDEDVPIPSVSGLASDSESESESDEDDADDEAAALRHQIERDLSDNFHHDPVPVPKHANPFADD